MKNKEKLLIIDLGKAYGGMEKLLENLILGFRNEFEITLAINSCGEFNEKSNIFNECKVLKFNNNSKTFIKTIWKLVKYVKTEKIKVIHCNGTPSNIIGMVLKKFLDVKFISTIHSDIVYEFEGRKRFIYLKIEKMTAKYANCVVSVSADLEKKLKCRHNKDSDKFKTIYNGVDFGNDQRIGESKNEELKILFVGRLVEIKNIEYLLENIHSFKNSNRKFSCDIIGEGELKEDLKRMCSEKGITEYVNFLGYKDNIKDYMNNSDLLVMTSKMEGIPLVIIEAFSSMLPVISSSVGGIVEMIEHNKTGILFDLNENDKLSKILIDISNDKYDLNKISQCAFDEYKNKWTREAMITRYRELYLS